MRKGYIYHYHGQKIVNGQIVTFSDGVCTTKKPIASGDDYLQLKAFIEGHTGVKISEGEEFSLMSLSYLGRGPFDASIAVSFVAPSVESQPLGLPFHPDTTKG